MTEPEITDDRDQQRLVLEQDGHTAVVRYALEEGGRIRLTHTKVPPPLEGQGIGSRLARHALETARSRDLKVWPECPFIGSYIRRHPEYLELVDDEFPRKDGLRVSEE